MPLGAGRGAWFGQSRDGIGLRLLVSVLLFSSAVTLTLTTVQLYLDYDRGVGTIEARLDEIERGYQGSLAESLWNLDRTQLQLQLDGIRRLPDIVFVEAREINEGRAPLIVAVGERGTHSLMVREFPLSYVVRAQNQPIGAVRIEASLRGVYRELMERALIILVSQGAKTFLVSLFIVFIVHRLVTRHLIDVAEFVGSFDFTRPSPPLALERTPPVAPDELDRVVKAFNDLCASLGRAYDDLRANEQRFRDYAETASDWFWETGPTHDFTWFSDAGGNIAGELNSLIGQRRGDCAVDQQMDPGKWREHLATLDRQQPFRNFEYKWRDSRGRLRHASVSGRPVFDPAGRFIGYRGTATDLTERREAEERLHQAEKMDAVGQLTGGIAHDFNNLLTVIGGTTEMLAEDATDRPDLMTRLRMIDEATRRGVDLTLRLLAFARKQPLQPRSTDVNALVADTVRLLRSTIGEHIEIASTLGRDVWRALIDPSQLTTALLNLAVNARDAMAHGGTLRIETGNVVVDEAYVRTRPDARAGSFVMVAVSDTGTGIPQSIRDKVFEPFFTTKAAGKGTGLGLSMVYGFVKQSGGHVEVDSEEGRGTTIRLYLPRAIDDAAASTEDTSVAPAPARGERILVIEDDDLVRSYVLAQLQSLGYRTIAAGNGMEALALVDRGADFDLLFTDVIVPGGLNGRELAAAIVKRRPTTRVLYTSGYSEDAAVHQGHLDPGVALLSKPYRKVDLARRIRDALDG